MLPPLLARFAGAAALVSLPALPSSASAVQEAPRDGLEALATVRVGLNPHQIVFSPDGERAYVAAAGSDRIAVVDARTYRVRSSIDAEGTPLGLAVLGSGASLAVARFGSDRLVRIGANAGAVLDEIDVGGAPSLIVGPLPGQTFLISSEQTNRLLVLDGGAFELRGSFPVGARPFPPGATSDGSVVLVPAYDDGTVTRVDLPSGRVAWTTPVGARPSGGAVLPGDTVYAVAVRGEDRLALLDVRSGAVVGEVRDGIGEGPFSVVVSPALRVAFVNNTASHDVSVVDLESLSVVGRVPVPEIPIVMAVHPNGGTLWVSSEGEDALTVLAVPDTYRLPQPQGSPGTDVWLAHLQARDGWVELGDPARITDRDGYDNQPHILPGGKTLLYTSIDRAGQADIWQADLASGTTQPFTRTDGESEYSATLMPDGEGISVIRVEQDGTQRLWRFDMTGQNPSLLVEDVAPVGYQAWGAPDQVAVFVLGDPPTLQLVDLTAGTTRLLAERVGRSLHSLPGRAAISFVQFDESGEGLIRAVDVATGVVTTLTRARPGSQDYAWTPEAVLLMAEGSVLYQWTPAGDWRVVTDLAEWGLGEITRLAVSPEGDRLALVAAR